MAPQSDWEGTQGIGIKPVPCIVKDKQHLNSAPIQRTAGGGADHGDTAYSLTVPENEYR